MLAETHIHILGSVQNIKIARDAVVSLILGSPPGQSMIVRRKANLIIGRKGVCALENSGSADEAAFLDSFLPFLYFESCVCICYSATFPGAIHAMHWPFILRIRHGFEAKLS